MQACHKEQGKEPNLFHLANVFDLDQTTKVRYGGVIGKMVI